MVTARFEARLRGAMLVADLGALFLAVGMAWAAAPPPFPGVPQPQPPGPDQPIEDYGNISNAPLWIPHQPITAIADVIMAEACLRVGTAEAYLLCGIGRNYHAVARSRELDNTVKEVDTYFKRRLLHDYYMDQLAIASHARPQERLLQEMEDLKNFKNKRIQDAYQGEKDSRLVESLNWMLTEVFRRRLELFGTTGVEPPPLSPDQIKDVWVTRNPVRGLAWRVDAPTITNERWPLLLQDPGLQTEVDAFEKVYAAARAEVNAQGKLDKATPIQLAAARDALEHRFYEIHAPGSSPQDYANAKGYLGHLHHEVERLLQAVPGKGGEVLSFDGRDVGHLVDYMGLNGLYFAKPARDGVGSYQYLFFGLRSMAGLSAEPPAK